MMAFLRRHPVFAYFALTFGISWTGVLTVILASGGLAGVKAQDSPLFPVALVAMVAGPSVAGLVMTRVLDGSLGLRKLRARLCKWRVGMWWYAVALLTAPCVSIAVTLALSLVSPEFLPAFAVVDDKTALVLLGLIVAMIAGFFEELGWTGFAIPRLKGGYSVLAAGLLMGVIWSAWHIPVVAWGMGDRAGTIPLPVFMIVDGLGMLPAFRVLMVWVYDRTESLFIAMLMHLSLTASVLILTPQTSGAFLLAHGLATATAVWLLLAAITATRQTVHQETAAHA